MADAMDAETESAFGERVRAWLAQHAEPALVGTESRMVDHRMDAEIVAAAKAWQRMLYDGGLAGLQWPTDWGGAGLSTAYAIAFHDVAREFQHPTDKVTAPALTMFGPAIMAYGSQQQKEHYLPRILTGEDVWCQLFSEPEAGSDLAGVRTRIVRDGDTLIVDGQKVWSSRAQYADVGMLLGRSDPDAPKHQGLTCLVVDMRTPGIEARPIRQMDGGDSFAEVFFTQVRVPATAILGDWNDGWAVAKGTLANERFTIAARARNVDLDRLRELARTRGLLDDPDVRRRLADIYVKSEVLRYLGVKLETAARTSTSPGPAGSVAKLLYGELIDQASALGVELLGAWGTTRSGDLVGGSVDTSPDQDGFGFWQSQLLGAPSAHIAGGTDQILRNIIAERILGLPREPVS